MVGSGGSAGFRVTLYVVCCCYGPVAQAHSAGPLARDPPSVHLGELFCPSRRTLLSISANSSVRLGEFFRSSRRILLFISANSLTDWLVTAVLHLFAQLISACEGYQPSLGPPVLNASIAGGGQYAFVEFRDETICETAMQFTGAMKLE